MEKKPPQSQAAPASTNVLTKADINLLPLKRYEGLVEIIDSDERLVAAMPLLLAERVVGFDIEVRPTFKSGDHFPPALVQLAGRSSVWLVQLKKIGNLSPLGALLSARRVIKAGVAVAGDIAKLHEIVPFEPAGFVELGKMAGKKGYRASGVRTLAAGILGFRISKGAQCSNWERSALAPAQVIYAATDAWICREIFVTLEKMPDIFTKHAKHEEKTSIE